MRSMSKVGRSRSIPAGPALKHTVRSLTRAQMYRPQIGLKLGMEKKVSAPEPVTGPIAFSSGFSNGFQ